MVTMKTGLTDQRIRQRALLASAKGLTKGKYTGKAKQWNSPKTRGHGETGPHKAAQADQGILALNTSGTPASFP